VVNFVQVVVKDIKETTRQIKKLFILLDLNKLLTKLFLCMFF